MKDTNGNEMQFHIGDEVKWTDGGWGGQRKVRRTGVITGLAECEADEAPYYTINVGTDNPKVYLRFESDLELVKAFNKEATP